MEAIVTFPDSWTASAIFYENTFHFKISLLFLVHLLWLIIEGKTKPETALPYKTGTKRMKERIQKRIQPLFQGKITFPVMRLLKDYLFLSSTNKTFSIFWCYSIYHGIIKVYLWVTHFRKSKNFSVETNSAVPLTS